MLVHVLTKNSRMDMTSTGGCSHQQDSVRTMEFSAMRKACMTMRANIMAKLEKYMYRRSVSLGGLGVLCAVCCWCAPHHVLGRATLRNASHATTTAQSSTVLVTASTDTLIVGSTSLLATVNVSLVALVIASPMMPAIPTSVAKMLPATISCGEQLSSMSSDNRTSHSQHLGLHVRQLLKSRHNISRCHRGQAGLRCVPKR